MTRKGCCSVAVVLAISSGAATASAQSWSSGTTPQLSEIVAIDATGEPGWLYGAEDLAGDGATFQQQEQSVDIRTAYASTNQTRFFARVYVSDVAAPGGTISAFIFIDLDNNPGTGGGADANEIDPSFTTDPSNGGYEFVIGVAGNETIVDIWAWNATLFESVMPMAADASAEVGTDTDPILIGSATHGYLQAMVNLDVVGLNPTCNARIYVRSVNDSGTGDSDLDVGQLSDCVPADTDSDGIPNIVEETTDDCTTDDQCFADLVCDNGDCVDGATPECTTDTDCPPGEECDPSGQCAVPAGGSCTSNSECGDLVCKGTPQTCQNCTPGSNECGFGRTCTASGVCVDDNPSGAGGGGGAGGDGVGRAPLDGEDVEGGACACALWERGTSGTAAALFGLVAAFALRWRRRPRR